ncbi:MAG: TlpA disulfide reductase family protein [Spirochaetia bacterium]
MRKYVLLIAALVMSGMTSGPKVFADSSTASPAVITDQLKKAGIEAPSREVMAEDFSLEALDGSKVSLSSLKRKVVLLSFWATWCGPCKQEMPAMQALYQKLRDKGFVVLAVDMMEDKDTVAKFVKTAGYTFPVLLDSTGEVGGGAYSARAIPTNYIVDKGGRLVGRKIGIDGLAWTSNERIALFETLLSQ